MFASRPTKKGRRPMKTKRARFDILVARYYPPFTASLLDRPTIFGNQLC